MLSPGPAQRVVIHLNEDSASGGDYLHLEVVSFLHAFGVSGATVLRGYAGFGFHRRIHTQGAPGTSGEHLPMRIEFVESRQIVSLVMPKLIELVTDGVIEVLETTIVHVATPDRSRDTREQTG